MSTPGHLFVVQADITKLACDIWILPSKLDVWCGYECTWIKWLSSYNSNAKSKETKHKNIIEQDFGEDFPLIFTFDTTLDAYFDSVKLVLAEIFELAKENKIRAPRFYRERRSIGLPIINIGANETIVKKALNLGHDFVNIEPFCDIILVAKDQVCINQIKI